MKIAKRLLFGTGSVAVAAAILTLALPKAAHGVVATLVQLVNTAANPVPVTPGIPAQPLTLGSSITFGFGTTDVFGPGTGTWAIGSITATNLSDAATAVFVSAATTTGGPGTCGGLPSSTGAEPNFFINIPARQTVHLSFPTPVVYAPFGGQTCIYVNDHDLTGGSVTLSFVGSRY